MVRLLAGGPDRVQTKGARGMRMNVDESGASGLDSVPMTPRQSYFGLLGFLVATFAVSVMGGVATSSSVDTWYRELAKPEITPPDWVFPVAWTILYVLMAIAAWRVWRAIAETGHGRRALAAWWVQLGLNLAWSVIFFGLRAPGVALMELVLLAAAIAVTIALFLKVDRIAAALMFPYAAWVTYAAVLNGAIVALNP